MKIHSKYRQNEKRNNKNKAKQHLKQYFLINLCVKPLERRAKKEKRENSLHRIGGSVLTSRLGHSKRERRNNLNKLFAIVEWF